MALNLATFRTRTLSAVVFVVVMLVGLFWDFWSFFALFTLIHFGCWKEYVALMRKIDPGYAASPRLWTLGFPLLGWGGMWWAASLIYPWSAYVAYALFFIGLVLIVPGAFRRGAGRNVWYDLAGLCYISLAWSTMVLLRDVSQLYLGLAHLFSGDLTFFQRFILPATLPCILIFSIWINDTMAYIVGSFIGRTPFSSISPKKTWEGTLGGALLCIGAMTLLGYYMDLYKLQLWIVLSAIAAIAGTGGDLLESKLKRMAGVKDSGHILPGHGGFLDRFDSLLLATPLALAYVYIIG